MSTEIHFFHTKTCQTEPNESIEFKIPNGTLIMRFILYKRNGSRRLDTQGDIIFDAPNVVVKKIVVFGPSELLSNRGKYTGMMKELICSGLRGLPEDEHPDIIAKTFKAIEVAVPGLVIDIFIADYTVRLLGCATSVEEYHKIVNGVTMEFMHISKRIAATKLSIDGLEKVTPDRLDLTVRQTPCVICMDDLDLIDDVVEDKIIHPRMITRLPCSHLYHGDCIVDWLLISHLCPLCRYPIAVVKVPCELPSLVVTDEGPISEITVEEVVREGPIVEVIDDQPIMDAVAEQPNLEVADESSKTSWQVDWPMLLKMSAGGILTAIVLFRLLK